MGNCILIIYFGEGAGDRMNANRATKIKSLTTYCGHIYRKFKYNGICYYYNFVFIT